MVFQIRCKSKVYSGGKVAAFPATNYLGVAASHCRALHEVARSRASQGFGYESASPSTAALLSLSSTEVAKMHQGSGASFLLPCVSEK